MTLKLFDLKNSKTIKELDFKGVYQITCTTNNKKYIGSTASSFIKRLIKHKSELINNKHHCYYLQNTFNKYGKDNFTFQILETIQDDNIIYEREQYYISSIKPELNCRLNVQKTIQTYSTNNIILNRNKDSFTNIIYFERFKKYKSYITINNQEILLDSSIVKEEITESIKKAEDYFWNAVFDSLNDKLKNQVIKQYKNTCRPCKSFTKVPGIYASKSSLFSFYINIDNKKVCIIGRTSFDYALKIKQEAEKYFFSEAFMNLNCLEKEKALKLFKYNIFLNKPVNKKIKSNKICGNRYIVWSTNLNRWIVKLIINKKVIILGSFYNKDEALKIRNRGIEFFNSDKLKNLKDEIIKTKLIQEFKHSCHLLGKEDKIKYTNNLK